MPYWWRPYRRRWRRIWRRRPRPPFRRRRFWRKRRYWVRRKKKLQKITLKQWQPSTIHKLTVKGQYPLFAGTTDRIGNDYTAYIDSIAPHNVPGGGLFSIIVFTLNGLYELHQKARNWWTTSNCNLPLIRYNGCTIKLYTSPTVDYITVPVNCGELKATEETFQSCQPSVLYLNKKKRVLLCKKFKTRRKPFKKIFVKPPALLLNKWYFQKELANFPLLMLLTSAASFDRYYLPASAISETMGFESLNTSYFQNHGFKRRGTQPYTPNSEFALFAVNPQNRTVTYETAKVSDLILLGNSQDYTLGQPISSITQQSEWRAKITLYMSKVTNWGNPFVPFYFGAEHSEEHEYPIIVHLSIKNTTVLNALQNIGQDKKITDAGFQRPAKPFTIHCRYNPQADMGHNAVFITRIQNDEQPWHKPTDDSLIQQGYPIWLIYWGWHDYLVKAHTVQNLDTDYINVIVSDNISYSPKDQDITYFVPLDWFFLKNRSPYGEEDGDIKIYDKLNWHPKANFQMLTISELLQTGPATAKLPPKVSAEAHMTYKFHFKVGGCPPSMDQVCNPQTQPSYPEPGNLLSSILLQNPEYPIQYYISSFDQRRDILTKRAAKRLKTDSEFKDTVLKPTGKTLLEVQTKSPPETSTDSSQEESEEETQQLLQYHRKRHRKLRHRIIRLLEKL
nr:MAG: ORF1 [TTV-like mini virus]UGV34815.1 MAG: ORF1 [TTV-like mini virus]UGV42357.1 MAG: ORF1 [TTV-like mini virus]